LVSVPATNFFILKQPTIYTNQKVGNISKKVLSDNWYTLQKITFDYLRSDGSGQTQQREAYDRGNGAVTLL
jgi:hypothetical protein